MQRFAIPVLLLALLGTGCAPAQAPTSVDRIAVSASIYPLGFVAERVGGDLVSVQLVTPAGSEPHEYEPTPQQLTQIYDSKVLLFNGGGIDPWAERLHAELDTRGVRVVEALETVTSLPAETEEHAAEEEGHAAEDSHDHANDGRDPHVWQDPLRLVLIARALEAQLIALAPEHSAVFQASTQTLVNELNALDAEYQTGLATCQRREIVTAHNAFAYLGDRYGLTIHPISGLSPENEPSAGRLAELKRLAKDEGVTTIFFETLTSPKLSETLAAEVGARTAVLNPLEGLRPADLEAGQDYLSVMRENLRAIRASLDCQ